jgi:nucleotide-binding universal stress UspA family protein
VLEKILQYELDHIHAPKSSLFARNCEAAMKIERVLFATDFSESSRAALEYASRFASEAGARMYIVHVDSLLDIKLPTFPPELVDSPYDAPWGHERHEIRQRLTTIVPTVPSIAYEHFYLTGSPPAQILKLAERERIDLIVMGSHGRTGLSKLLMGSVAEGVMRRAKCPVLIVKLPVNEPEIQNVVSSAGAIT